MMSSDACGLMRGVEMARELGAEALSAVVWRNAVVVFTKSGCCMSHTVKHLLFGLGVSPTTVELRGRREAAAAEAIIIMHQGMLMHMGVVAVPVFPAVFVGGRYLGGVETIIGYHINGWLVPLLKYAGALWL